MYWDVNLTKINGALKTIPEEKIPVFTSILRQGLCQHVETYQHGGKSTLFEFDLNSIRFEKHEDDGVFIVSLKFRNEGDDALHAAKIQTEKLIYLSFKKEGYENIHIFYDEERYN